MKRKVPGDLTEDAVWPQYQTDIPRKPIHRQFNIHVGHCNTCDERLQGRHARQTSDALGAAASPLSPDLQAALVLANQELGLSHGKGQQFFGRLFGVEFSLRHHNTPRRHMTVQARFRLIAWA